MIGFVCTSSCGGVDACSDYLRVVNLNTYAHIGALQAPAFLPVVNSYGTQLFKRTWPFGGSYVEVIHRGSGALLGSINRYARAIALSNWNDLVLGVEEGPYRVFALYDGTYSLRSEVSVTAPGYPVSIVASPFDRTAAVFVTDWPSKEGTAEIYDIDTLGLQHSVPLGAGPSELTMVFTDTGRLLVFDGTDVKQIDLATGGIVSVNRPSPFPSGILGRGQRQLAYRQKDKRAYLLCARPGGRDRAAKDRQLCILDPLSGTMTFRLLSGRGSALELCLTPDEKKLLIAMEEKDGSTYLDEIVLQTDTLNEQVLALDPNPKGDPDSRTGFNWIIAPHWQHLALPRIIPPTYDPLWYFKTHGGLTPPGPPQPWTAPTPQETDFGIALWLKALAFQMADAEARKEILKTADAVLSRDLKEKKTKGRKR